MHSVAPEVAGASKRMSAPEMVFTLIVIVWTVLSSIVTGLFTIVISLFGGSENIVHLSARFWARTILAVGRIDVTVEGMSNIDSSKPYIFMSNHQSNFDIPVLLAHLKIQFRWLAKAELFKIPIFGRGMKNAGYISIDRSNRRAAVESLHRAAEIIRDGVSVLIFPEGTRSLDGNVRPFKKGGFVLAVDAGVPIVPVVIHGTYSIMQKNRLRIKPGHVLVEILDPIKTSDYTRGNKDDLMERVRTLIRERFEKRRQHGQPC